jgi:hypothetical protein
VTTANAELIEQVSHRLFVVHDQIFEGLPEDEFVRYVFRSEAERTKIRLFYGESGDIVGYGAVHLYKREIRGRPVSIFRAESGLLLGYRGHVATHRFYMLEVLKHRLLHPAESVVYLGMLVHPSSYLLLTQSFWEIYPRYDRETPQAVSRLMQDMADMFLVEAVDTKDPLVRRVGWITREERVFWQQTNAPEVAFFRSRNPGYHEGHGLVVLVPLTFTNLILSLIRFSVSYTFGLSGRTTGERTRPERSQN